MSSAQRCAIYGLAKAAQLDKDALHDVVRRVARRDSIAELTTIDAIRVIDTLKGIAGQAPGRQSAGERIGWMTDAQERKIYALCRELGWVTEQGEIDRKRLDGFIKCRFAIAQWRWVDARTASMITEALKKMAKGGRGERKRKEQEDQG